MGDIRSPRHSSPRVSEGLSSSTHLAPENSEAPHLSPIPTDTSFSRMRKLINDIYRSGSRGVTDRDTTQKTFDDLTSADLNYNH